MRSYQGSNVNEILRKPLSEKNRFFVHPKHPRRPLMKRF
jgi:hypothetical protein